MQLRRRFPHVVVWFLMMSVSIGALPIFGHQKNDNNKDKKRSESKDKVYKEWPKEVQWIITDEERKSYDSLQTDDEREAFIERFWQRRDPDPDTPENEYKDEYYRRVAYADAHYTSGIPGRNTDRGRIYIRFGPPDSVDSHPAGGQYERTAAEGGGSTSTYPFETWFYRHLDNVGEGVEIEFVDPTMSGEYHVAHSPDEKDALLYVPGAGLTLSEQMNLSSKTDRIAFGGLKGDPLSGQYNKEFERLETLYNIDKVPAIAKLPGLSGSVDPVLAETEVLPVALRTDYVRAGQDVITSFSILIENKDLALANKGGIYQGTVNVSGKVTQIIGGPPRFFEQAITTARYTDRDVADGQQVKSIYQMKIMLEPGRYKLDLVAQDINSGKLSIIHQSFIVPRYKPSELSTSSVILASDITQLDGVAAGQFVIGRYKVHPNISGTFKPGVPFGVFLQIYNTSINQYTLMPNVNVDYVVTHDGAEVARITEDGKAGIKDIDGPRLTVGRMLALKLEPGTYQVSVNILDKVSGKTLNTVPTTFIVK
ncbi:MAG TPA: GWxTD domain-containing protein [Blastocatellia bacterium]|nr:GWxTD domain-containing protein [Blastocatellia bacterium]